MADIGTRLVEVPEVRLEASDSGAGEPVVLVQTALTADELRPLAADSALDAYRKILYHRRGYARSSPAHGAGSIQRDAADCRSLLRQLRVDRAHVVGLSFSCAIALQLAADDPNLVHTLTLIEPPPVHVPSAPEFRAANDRLLQTRAEHGPAAALDEFLTMLVGADWPRALEDQLPGSVAQMRRDAATFFDHDLPALLDWNFSRTDAGRIDCPVLYVGGTLSGTWFAEVRELIRAWFPQSDDVLLEGADHSLAVTHASQCAVAVASFLRRHPIR